MDDLQYSKVDEIVGAVNELVLNLVINGWPSIPTPWADLEKKLNDGFKPCYKWMTFNTWKTKCT